MAPWPLLMGCGRVSRSSRSTTQSKFYVGIATDCIHTAIILLRRDIDKSNKCRICGVGEETGAHLFFSAILREVLAKAFGEKWVFPENASGFVAISELLRNLMNGLCSRAIQRSFCSDQWLLSKKFGIEGTLASSSLFVKDWSKAVSRCRAFALKGSLVARQRHSGGSQPPSEVSN